MGFSGKLNFFAEKLVSGLQKAGKCVLKQAPTYPGQMGKAI